MGPENKRFTKIRYLETETRDIIIISVGFSINILYKYLDLSVALVCLTCIH